MNQKGFAKIVLIVAVIILAGVVGFFVLNNWSATSYNIPSSVLAKYEELEPQYSRSLGARISYCTKNTEKVYTVSGSGGFSGVTFYYNEDGREIGSSTWTDAIDPNNPPPKPPVNIQEYDCTVIKDSK